MAERRPPKAARHLLASAGIYEESLAELANADTGKATMASPAGREKLAALVDRMAALEAGALDEMEQAADQLR